MRTQPSLAEAEPHAVEFAGQLNVPHIADVVLVLKDEDRGLGGRLRRLSDRLAERIPWTCRLTLVDRGSRDDTWREICDFVNADLSARGIRFADATRASAVRCAWTTSPAPVVVLLDGSCIDEPDALSPLVAAVMSSCSSVALGLRPAPDGREPGVFRPGDDFDSIFLDQRVGMVAVRASIARELLGDRTRTRGWSGDDVAALAGFAGIRVCRLALDERGALACA